jgi:hypothetical protein
MMNARLARIALDGANELACDFGMDVAALRAR